jgi:hypothetical protein
MIGTLDGKVILAPPNSQNFVPSSFLPFLGKIFCLIYFSQSFNDEIHSKVKNR